MLCCMLLANEMKSMYGLFSYSCALVSLEGAVLSQNIRECLSPDKVTAMERLGKRQQRLLSVCQQSCSSCHSKSSPESYASTASPSTRRPEPKSQTCSDSPGFPIRSNEKRSVSFRRQ